jgi:hypothetical protein
MRDTSVEKVPGLAKGAVITAISLFLFLFLLASHSSE